MSWSASFIDTDTLNTLIADGHVKTMYDDSKKYIENGNYYYPDNYSEDDKYQHWLNTFHNHASNKVNDGNKIIKLICIYKDGDPKLIHAGYYQDGAFHSCHSICKSIDGSNAYVFYDEPWIPTIELVKPLGATAWSFHQTKGGSIAFRSLTARHCSSIFEYSDIKQETINEVVEVTPREGSEVPTIDGSTKENDTRQKRQYIIDEVVTTINFK